MYKARIQQLCNYIMSGFEEGLTETVHAIVHLLEKDGNEDCRDGYTETKIREQFDKDSR